MNEDWRDALSWPVHPAADLFPMMEGPEFDALVEWERRYAAQFPGAAAR